MKIFVYEHSSGGGLTNRALPSSLTYKGEMILHALLLDLLAVPDVDIIMMRDPCSPPLDLPLFKLVVPEYGQFEACFDACIEEADAVWLVAPESCGILERLSRTVIDRHRILLGCQPEAVHIAASKARTARALASADIPVVPTYLIHDDLPDEIAAWVVKPDDGAGCFDTRIFASGKKAVAWMNIQGKSDYVLQPFIYGKPCGMLLLCCDGKAWVLSCNDQRIVVADNQFHYLGCTVNGMDAAASEFVQLAQTIAQAMPTLWGYVGVDFIMTNNGAVVLEINPRITTACAGLRASIKHNPAELVLRLVYERTAMQMPSFASVAISVDVEAFNLP